VVPAIRGSPRCLAAALGLLLCAASPATVAGHAYVSNEGAGTVSVIDTDSGRVVATLAVGKRPRGLKLSRDGSRLYVAVSGVPRCVGGDMDCDPLKHDLLADGIAVVDTRALKLLKTLSAGSDPAQLDVTPEGRRLFVANADTGGASVVDAVTGDRITRIPVGRGAESVCLSPDGAWALVVSQKDSIVSLIDTHLLELVRTVAVGQRPRDATFSSDGRFAYILGELDASLYRIAVPSGQPVQRLIQLRRQDHPLALTLDAPEHRLYVSSASGGRITVVALDDPHVLAEITVGVRPHGMALTHDRALLFAANSGSNDVSVIDTASFHIIKTIAVGRSPWGVAIGN
jgi:YVTN family beta-propeller protein